MWIESPPPILNNAEMEDLEKVLAASHLSPRDNSAGPSQLLSPIYLKGVSLSTIEDKMDMALAPVAMVPEVLLLITVAKLAEKGEDVIMALLVMEEGKNEEALAAMKDEWVLKAAAVVDDEDVAGEEDLEMQEQVADKEGKKNKAAMEVDMEEGAREEPNWQWLPSYSLSASWACNVSDIAGLEPLMCLLVHFSSGDY